MPANYEIELHERSGPPVRIEAWGRDVPNPAVVSISKAASGGDVVLQLEIDRQTGRARTTIVEVVARDAEAITGTTLRSFRLPELVAVALRYLRTPADEINGGSYAPTHLTWLTAADFERIAAGEPVHSDGFEQYALARDLDMAVRPEEVERLRKAGPSSTFGTRAIAQMFEDAADSGESPNRYIESRLGWSPSTVSYWVSKAREAGALAPTTRKPKGRL